MVVPHSAHLGSCFAPFGSSLYVQYVTLSTPSCVCFFSIMFVYYCYTTTLLPSPLHPTPPPPCTPYRPHSPSLPPQSYHKRSITASICPTPAFQDLPLKKLAQPHLLVCAPSNAGIDEIVRRLLAEGLVVDTHQWRQQQAQQVEL